MKKIVIIIALIMLIFQMITLATVIEIGYEAIDGSGTSDNRTCINANAANATGKITSVDIWANTELADCEVAIFTEGEANVFTTRDWETVDNGNGVGVVLAGSKQTFVVDLNVVAGDVIGIYYSAGAIELDASGSRWYSPATTDWIPCTDETFTQQDLRVSLYGTGTTEEGNAIWFAICF